MPESKDLLKTVAVARLFLGEEMNIQVPPNLNPGLYLSLIKAGINDWGGISPLTLDYVNPEATWPPIREIWGVTARAGYRLRERLAVYPEYIVGAPGFLAGDLEPRVRAATDGEGYVLQ